MKVLVNCDLPFGLTRGGQQIQVQRTMAFLQTVGLDVEPVRWWDDQQSGQLIHYFGRMPAGHIELAHKREIKVVMGELLTGTGSRRPEKLRLQRMLRILVQRFAPAEFSVRFGWDSYRKADALIAMTAWEAHLMNYLFGAPKEKIVIVPNGVEDAFFDAPATKRGQWLVCTATITERKRVLELAQAAVQTQTPLWIIGRPYSEADPYVQQFNALASQHPQLIRIGGPAFGERKALAEIYRAARGFVLLSAMETRSLAAEEAAACQCPLLLSDLPWARSVFGDQALYCPIGPTRQTAVVLRNFYDRAHLLKPPAKPLREIDVGRQLKGLYEKLLSQR